MRKLFCALLLCVSCISLFATEFNVGATLGYSNMYSSLRKFSNTKPLGPPSVKSREFYSTNVHNTLLASLNVYMLVEDGFTFAINNDFSFYGINDIKARFTNRMVDGSKEQSVWSAIYSIEGVFWNIETLFGYTFLFSALSDEPDVYLSVFAGVALGYGNLLPFDCKSGNVEADSFSHANDMGSAGFPVSILFQFYFSRWFGLAISLTDVPGLWASQYPASPDFDAVSLQSNYYSTTHRRYRNFGFMNSFHLKIGPTIRF